MPTGQLLTLWTVRIAALLYVAAVCIYVTRRSAGSDRLARVAWTAGLIFYLVHVCLAFEFFYGWSHTVAYRETARQTAEFFGVNSGAGVYFNYVFTLVWFADTLWWWRGLIAYRERPRWIPAAVHGFLAFIFFNATVVFGRGLVRYGGMVSTGLVLLLALRFRRRSA